jgi:hypothetical protein
MQSSLNQCSKFELDLTRTTPIQTSIENSIWDNIEPNSSWNSNSVITFNINGSNDKYIDLSQTRLYIKLDVKKGDAGIGTKSISTVNNFLHSLFKNIEVKIGSKTISTSNGKYPYRAYIENLLGFNKESKDILLRGDFWFKDNKDFDSLLLSDVAAVTEVKSEQGQITTAAVQAKSANEGFIKRNSLIKNGNEFELSGYLHLDISSFDKLIIPNNDIIISLTKSDPKFYLLGSESDCEGFKVNFQKMYLQIRRVTVSDSIMLGHATTLEKSPAIYPFKRVVINEVASQLSSTEGSFKEICKGIMPTRVIVGFVLTEAFTGSYNLNPYNFQNFGVNKLKLYINSTQLPYSTDLEFNYSNKNYFEGYSTLFTNIKHAPNDINYEEYSIGNTLYAFNLSPDLCVDDNLSLIKEGSLNLKCTFDRPINESITAVFYLEYENTIQIAKSGDLILDYTP